MPILWPLKVPERGDAIRTQRKTFPTHKSQAKEIKSSLKQKGIPVTVKPIDWIEAAEVLYTAVHHGAMQTIGEHLWCKATRTIYS